MRGLNVGTLNVYRLSPNETVQNVSTIWEMSGHQGNEWRRASVALSSEFHFQVCVKADQHVVLHILKQYTNKKIRNLPIKDQCL